MIRRVSFNIRVLILFIVSSYLWIEWLRPLDEALNIGNLKWLFLAAILFILTKMTVRSHLLNLTLIAVIMLFTLHRIYYAPQELSLFNLEWLHLLWIECGRYISLLVLGDWLSVPPLRLQSVGLILLIAFIAQVSFHAMVEKKRVLPILLLSLFYFAVLDSLTSFAAWGAVIRVFVVGVFLTTWMRWTRFAERMEEVPEPKGWYRFALFFLIAVVVVGTWAPKPAASWSDSFVFLPFVEGNGNNASGVGKIGYGKDDTKLGGPFIQDERIAIVASNVEVPYYWRGEAKSLYTGRGWSDSVEERVEKYPLSAENMEESSVEGTLFDNVKTEMNTADIFKEASPDFLVFTPGQLTSFKMNVNVNSELLVSSSKVELSGDMTDVYEIKSELKSEIPVINRKQLRTSKAGYPPDIRYNYLQLPPAFPERIRAQTERVIAGKDNPYDRAVAIEAYLRSNFTYDTEETSVPPKGSDFVDDFLFESKVGYCNHFSTSMVVMLRSIGIPSRWVKGFAPGESAYNEKRDKHDVIVRNSDAHSWVEVYFAGIGWIPFEPTPGFTNPTPLEEETKKSDQGSEQDDSTSTNHSEADADRTSLERQMAEEAQVSATKGESSSIWKEWQGRIMWILTLLLLLAVITIKYWRTFYWWWLQRLPSGPSKGKQGVVKRTYQVLMLYAWRKGVRSPDQTVREYLLKKEWYSSPSKELEELTSIYEQARYGKDEGSGQSLWKKVDLLWRKLLQQLRP
ncbi:DUF3488 and transglutaminase-like domain-containing protein [Mechercharimyces sp. CAU 1602]|uniref:transglutaminase TgpA family protein n=1 Tax=Mechercharimyces sp. CAU 1602 TaxID=2973933 RepID=UPI0021631E42|nr:DUF3488 and transglutaminase-like domain-containing protein [Mechercharimyces sp. CAU 1602]MCS1352102.1 DUF3488 and transglutaminase-like domain-containing protein [Mechercharimyces sp. CAU 1602]